MQRCYPLIIFKMTVKYHFISIKFKWWHFQKLSWWQSNSNSHIVLLSIWVGTTTLESNFELSGKVDVHTLSI